MDEELTPADGGARWRWSVLPLHGLTFVANVCDAASTLFAGLAQEVAGHYNYEAAREGARELERLLEGDDG